MFTQKINALSIVKSPKRVINKFIISSIQIPKKQHSLPEKCSDDKKKKETYIAVLSA